MNHNNTFRVEDGLLRLVYRCVGKQALDAPGRVFHNNDLMLDESTISIQAESHPTDLRTIEIRVLES